MHTKRRYTLIVFLLTVVVSGCSHISEVKDNRKLGYKETPKVYGEKVTQGGQSVDTLKSFPEQVIRVGLGISGAGIGAYGVGSVAMGKEKWQKTVRESDTEETPSILKKYPAGPLLIAAGGVSALVVSIVWPDFLGGIFSKNKNSNSVNAIPKEIKDNMIMQKRGHE